MQYITLQRITNHIRDNKILASIYPSDNDDSILLQIYHCARIQRSTSSHHTNAKLQRRRNTNTMAYKYKYIGIEILEICCGVFRHPSLSVSPTPHLPPSRFLTLPALAWYHYNTMGVPFQCFNKYFQNPITICYFARSSVLTSLLIPSQQISNSTITRPKAIQPNPLLSILL